MESSDSASMSTRVLMSLASSAHFDDPALNRTFAQEQSEESEEMEQRVGDMDESYGMNNT